MKKISALIVALSLVFSLVSVQEASARIVRNRATSVSLKKGSDDLKNNSTSIILNNIKKVLTPTITDQVIEKSLSDLGQNDVVTTCQLCEDHSDVNCPEVCTDECGGCGGSDDEESFKLSR